MRLRGHFLEKKSRHIKHISKFKHFSYISGAKWMVCCRYGGFCPQHNYQIGDTFGRTTSRLLTDPGIASSGRLVLAEMYPSSRQESRKIERNSLIKRRTQSWGDQKYSGNMVPGYTGCISYLIPYNRDSELFPAGVPTFKKIMGKNVPSKFIYLF